MTNRQKKAFDELNRVKTEYCELMACKQLDVYEQIDYMLYLNDLEEKAYNEPCWEARAEYADGTIVDECFGYNEGGNHRREEERRHELEVYLINKHDDCVWYSVDVVE